MIRRAGFAFALAAVQLALSGCDGDGEGAKCPCCAPQEAQSVKYVMREPYDGKPDIEWIEDSVRDPAEAEKIARDYHNKFPHRLMGYRHGKDADAVAPAIFKAVEKATGYRCASCLKGDRNEALERYSRQPWFWQLGATYVENGDGTMTRIDARPPVKRDWKLVWSDEFNGDSLDTDTWWAADCWHGAEPQYYTSRKKNVRVENGMLVLECHREKFDTSTRPKTGAISMNGNLKGRDCYDPGRRYSEFTSGCVVTYKKRDFLYGRIEIRAKIPTGKWSWPALWLLGVNIQEIGWPRCGEVDILEYWGKSPRTAFATCHAYRPDSVYGAKTGHNRAARGDGMYNVDIEEGFHVYAVEWDKERMDFYYDGVHYFTYPVKMAETGGFNPFHHNQYLLINYALDHGPVGPVAADFEMPRRFEIDYVRYYK